VCDSAGIMYWSALGVGQYKTINKAFLDGTGKTYLMSKSSSFVLHDVHNGNAYFTDYRYE